jgi:hypothetical protein
MKISPSCLLATYIYYIPFTQACHFSQAPQPDSTLVSCTVEVF